MKKLSMQLLADTVVSRRKAMKITQAQPRPFPSTVTKGFVLYIGCICMGFANCQMG